MLTDGPLSAGTAISKSEPWFTFLALFQDKKVEWWVARAHSHTLTHTRRLRPVKLLKERWSDGAEVEEISTMSKSPDAAGPVVGSGAHS